LFYDELKSGFLKQAETARLGCIGLDAK
jgi:hypothetical protein